MERRLLVVRRAAGVEVGDRESHVRIRPVQPFLRRDDRSVVVVGHVVDELDLFWIHHHVHVVDGGLAHSAAVVLDVVEDHAVAAHVLRLGHDVPRPLRLEKPSAFVVVVVREQCTVRALLGSAVHYVGIEVLFIGIGLLDLLEVCSELGSELLLERPEEVVEIVERLDILLVLAVFARAQLELAADRVERDVHVVVGPGFRILVDVVDRVPVRAVAVDLVWVLHLQGDVVDAGSGVRSLDVGLDLLRIGHLRDLLLGVAARLVLQVLLDVLHARKARLVLVFPIPFPDVARRRVPGLREEVADVVRAVEHRKSARVRAVVGEQQPPARRLDPTPFLVQTRGDREADVWVLGVEPLRERYHVPRIVICHGRELHAVLGIHVDVLQPVVIAPFPRVVPVPP